MRGGILHTLLVYSHARVIDLECLNIFPERKKHLTFFREEQSVKLYPKPPKIRASVTRKLNSNWFF